MRDVVSSLLRRWYLTAAGAVATIALAVAAVYLVPPTYQATGSVVLLPPASTVEAGGNPYLQLGGLNQVADVLTRSMMAQNTAESVEVSHPTATYTVAPDPATSGPILVVTAADRSPGDAAATLTAVMALVPAKLAEIQRTLGYVGRTQITSTVLAKDDQPETVRKTQLRALIAAVGAGLVITALLVAVTDGLIERRHRRRAGAREAADASHPPAPPAAPAVATTPPAAPMPGDGATGDAVPRSAHRERRSQRYPRTLTPTRSRPDPSSADEHAAARSR